MELRLDLHIDENDKIKDDNGENLEWEIEFSETLQFILIVTRKPKFSNFMDLQFELSFELRLDYPDSGSSVHEYDGIRFPDIKVHFEVKCSKKDGTFVLIKFPENQMLVKEVTLPASMIGAVFNLKELHEKFKFNIEEFKEFMQMAFSYAVHAHIGKYFKKLDVIGDVEMSIKSSIKDHIENGGRTICDLDYESNKIVN